MLILWRYSAQESRAHANAKLGETEKIPMPRVVHTRQAVCKFLSNDNEKTEYKRDAFGLIHTFPSLFRPA
jgi:hypothetical protein